MRLALTSLTLSQFRSHARWQQRFEGGPVAIFGPNGAGKTNILEAISLFSPGRGLRRAAPEDLARRPQPAEGPGPGWKLTATSEGPDGAHELETRALPGAPRSLRIDGKAAPQLALGGVLRMLWLVPAMDRLWTEAPEGRRRLLDRIALSFRPGHAEAALAYDKALRQRNRLLREGARDGAWFAALEGQMAGAAVALHANRAHALARIAAAPGSAAFPSARLALVDGQGAALPGAETTEAEATGAEATGTAMTAEGLRALWAGGRARDRAAGRTLSGPHRSDLAAVWAEKGLPAAQCSTGEQKALLIALILANARALKAELGVAPVLLLDEVAAHLDAGRRAALYAELLALGAQAFLTGTGAELFASAGAAFQRIELRAG